MSTDQLVQVGDVHEALRLVQTQPHGRILQQLERIEPDLAEHVFDDLSRLHRALLKTDLSDEQILMLYEQGETLVLVSLLSLRTGLVRLWREHLGGTQLVPIERAQEDPQECERHERSEGFDAP